MNNLYKEGGTWDT